jgi:hypothetical protein
MGRPPIGKRAMTSTERSRRYRAGKTVKPEAATTPQADPSAETDQQIVRREREQLRAIRAILRLLEDANDILDEMLHVERIEFAPDGRIHLILSRQAPADDRVDRTMKTLS